ncbi:class II glutamine amidotransferase [Tsuneonella mangrovi]|uniref:class II glutamine amidotransferase n=1 Tax=Tsuneonella mangrovi TaxID=1982042 RepID=UPI000BA2B540|nr:class II glutamine amidotransferase [Tsuneonella mangrovi]
MCELFAMSSAKPGIVRYELDSFAAEGGEKHRNRDGWGILFAEDRDAHVFREAAPAADSELARMVVRREIPTRTLLAHVRRASRGQPRLANTHPFTRVRGGRLHAFAHNGDLPGIEGCRGASAVVGDRVGETDSELVFLLLLDRLDALGSAPAVAERFDVFARLAAEMRELGSSNFLFFDGDCLFVHADRRRYETADGLTEPREPGLNIRRFEKHEHGREWRCNGAILDEVSEDTILFASVPLDQGEWEPLPRGTALALKGGEIVDRRPA